MVKSKIVHYCVKHWRLLFSSKGRRGRDRMIAGFTTDYSISLLITDNIFKIPFLSVFIVLPWQPRHQCEGYIWGVTPCLTDRSCFLMFYTCFVRHYNVSYYFISEGDCFNRQTGKVWICQWGNQKPKIEVGQTTQWPKEKRQKCVLQNITQETKGKLFDFSNLL
jgi:hypothetical protein